MMVSLCLGRWTTSLHHQQPIIISEEGDIIIWVWALPLATAKLGGGAPVSYHHHTPIFTALFSSILLVVSWSSRIKVLVWSSFEFCFMISLCNRVRELYNKDYCWVKGLIILPWSWVNKRKYKEIKRSKEIIWILWRVMSSHRKSMMNMTC